MERLYSSEVNAAHWHSGEMFVSCSSEDTNTTNKHPPVKNTETLLSADLFINYSQCFSTQNINHFDAI